MTTLYVTHDAFLRHDTGPGHPERIERLETVRKVLSKPEFTDLDRKEAPEADIADIVLAHPIDYVKMIQDSEPEGGDYVRLDADTVMSRGSFEAARRAVGAGIFAVDRIMAGEVKNAFCAVRPCGHHAETARAMGFCLFNNIAIAAFYARNQYQLDRVAVVDFDVHHGNGTQDLFWSDKNMFFSSTHQMPLFPGTGSITETGVGNIVNAPLNPGGRGTQFREAFETRVLPQLSNFSPEFILISAGFDAHIRDPLANLQLVEEDFEWATKKLLDIADKNCRGRIVSMLEGGYDLQGLGDSVASHVTAMIDGGS